MNYTHRPWECHVSETNLSTKAYSGIDELVVEENTMNPASSRIDQCHRDHRRRSAAALKPSSFMAVVVVYYGNEDRVRKKSDDESSSSRALAGQCRSRVAAPRTETFRAANSGREITRKAEWPIAWKHAETDADRSGRPGDDYTHQLLVHVRRHQAWICDKQVALIEAGGAGKSSTGHLWDHEQLVLLWPFLAYFWYEFWKLIEEIQHDFFE